MNISINRTNALRAIAFSAAAIAIAGLFVAAVVAYKVRFGDDSSFEKTAILAKLAHETPIYYLDGKSQLGSFFDSEHRRYITIDQVPEDLIHALVSSEDQNFFSHTGVDIIATGKALLEGISRAHFRRAGSSITQQTVKILYNDWQHSFSRKCSEAISALKLERLYSKREILEFYLNQFHVTGNGNGVGIAARYYFNKEVAVQSPMTPVLSFGLGTK